MDKEHLVITLIIERPDAPQGPHHHAHDAFHEAKGNGPKISTVNGLAVIIAFYPAMTLGYTSGDQLFMAAPCTEHLNHILIL